MEKSNATAWRHWNHEYLRRQQVREKRSRAEGPVLSVGTVVLVREDNQPPSQWNVRRIVFRQYANGVIRVADVRTIGGQFKRTVRQLCP